MFKDSHHGYSTVVWAYMTLAQLAAFGLMVFLPALLISHCYGPPKQYRTANKARSGDDTDSEAEDQIEASSHPAKGEDEKDEGKLTENYFDSSCANSGVSMARAGIWTTIILNFIGFIGTYFWVLGTTDGPRGGHMDYATKQSAAETYVSLIKIQHCMNMFGDSLFYLGVLLVWISISTTGELCGKNKSKKSEEDGDETESSALCYAEQGKSAFSHADGNANAYASMPPAYSTAIGHSENTSTYYK